MSDSATPRKPNALIGDNADEVPVEDLIRITREFTRRITNQDRQRLAVGLRESGHSRQIQSDAPITLQQFFAGEIDLDTELARRFVNAPLISHVHITPKPGEPIGRLSTAIFSAQDDSTIMTVDAHFQGDEAVLEFTFTLFSALALRFQLPGLNYEDRVEWIDLMRREDGIAFLWTREKWHQPYLIFVVREFFGRLYAFNPHGFEAAIRLTPDMIAEMINWLERLWFPEHLAARQATQIAPPRPISRPISRPIIPADQLPPELAPDMSAPPQLDFNDQGWDTPPEDDNSDVAANDLEW